MTNNLAERNDEVENGLHETWKKHVPSIWPINTMHEKQKLNETLYWVAQKKFICLFGTYYL